jgi:hypothetical protein
MRTLGIDLATGGSWTGICELDWVTRAASLEVGKVSTAELEELGRRAALIRGEGGWVAIDAPFGFPNAFTDAVSMWSTAGVLPSLDEDEVRWRLTDRCVAERQAELRSVIGGRWGAWPLSPVSSLITPTVVRTGYLLSAIADERLSRVGADGVIEVYPIASMRAWGLATGNYKQDASDASRLLADLAEGFGGVDTDHLLDSQIGDAADALVCALMARLVAKDGGTTSPTAAGEPYASNPERIEREGWIHLPPSGHRLADLS